MYILAWYCQAPLGHLVIFSLHNLSACYCSLDSRQINFYLHKWRHIFCTCLFLYANYSLFIHHSLSFAWRPGRVGASVPFEERYAFAYSQVRRRSNIYKNMYMSTGRYDFSTVHIGCNKVHRHYHHRHHLPSSSSVESSLICAKEDTNKYAHLLN